MQYLALGNAPSVLEPEEDDPTDPQVKADLEDPSTIRDDWSRGKWWHPLQTDAKDRGVLPPEGPGPQAGEDWHTGVEASGYGEMPQGQPSGQPQGEHPDDEMLPGMVGVTRGMLREPAPPPGASDEDYKSPDQNTPARPPSKYSAQENLARIRGEMPERKEPKWWQRGLAAGLGGAVGWTNAASRVKWPLDAEPGVENILYPGYQSKLAAWQNRVIKAQPAAELEASKIAMDQKERQLQSTIDLNKSHIDLNEGEGRSTMLTVTPQMEQMSGGLFRRDTKIPASAWNTWDNNNAGRWDNKGRRAPVTSEEKYAEAQRIYPVAAGGTPEAWRQMTYSPTSVGKPEAASRETVNQWIATSVDPDATPEERAAAEAKLKAHRTSTTNPDTEARLTVTQNRLKATAVANVNKRKNDEENRINQQRSAALAALTGLNQAAMTPADKALAIQRINNRAVSELRNAYSEYRDAGRALGSKINDIDIDLVDEGVDIAGKDGKVAHVGGNPASWIRYTQKEPVSQGVQAAADEANATARGEAPDPDQIQAAIRAEAVKQGVDPAQVLGLAQSESGFNPGAVSPTGATGVFQFTQGTARGMGIDREDVAQNIEGGVRYWKQLLEKHHGDVAAAVRAYKGVSVGGATEADVAKAQKMMGNFAGKPSPVAGADKPSALAGAVPASSTKPALLDRENAPQASIRSLPGGKVKVIIGNVAHDFQDQEAANNYLQLIGYHTTQ